MSPDQAVALDAVRARAAGVAVARQELLDAMRRADEYDVPRTTIAEAAGFSRQWTRRLLDGDPADA